MAIVTENIEINGKQFVRTYSDRGCLIHGGSPESNYTEAIDPAELGRTYTETAIPVNDEGDITAEEVFDALEEIL